LCFAYDLPGNQWADSVPNSLWGLWSGRVCWRRKGADNFVRDRVPTHRQLPVAACCAWGTLAGHALWNYVSMGVDLLLLIGLVALWRSYPAPTPDAPPHVRWGSWLFGLGVAAGIIMLLLRFTTEHAWWTGHLRGGGF
jgi:hypothetical protein